MLELAENASTVRQHFSEFFDQTIRDRPGFIKRRRDILTALNPDHLSVLLEPLRFHAVIERDADGSYVGTVAEVDDVVATGATVADAHAALAEELIDYAREYMGASFRSYFNTPNRRGHLPYVLKVALTRGVDDVQALIDADTSGS